MSLTKGLIGASIGGALGGGVWVGVAYATGYELALLAVLVGGAAGFGMGVGVKGRGGIGPGILAAAVAVVCILGAKFGVAHIAAQQWIAGNDLIINEDDARAALMQTVYDEFYSQGREMTRVREDEFPPEVWKEADRRWFAMSVTERADYQLRLQTEIRQTADEATGMVAALAFMFSFGTLDLVCLGLAVLTAYKTASANTNITDEVLITEDLLTDNAPAMFKIATEDAAAHGAIALAAAPGSVAPSPTFAEPRPTPAARSATENTPRDGAVPTGLGIFAMLGNEPAPPFPPARPVLPNELDETPSRSTRQDQTGLIDLDLDGEHLAA